MADDTAAPSPDPGDDETSSPDPGDQDLAVATTDGDMPKAFAGGRNLDQFMPVILFFGFYRFADSLILAVLASSLWSVKAAISRKRRGLAVGWFLPGVGIYLLVRAIATISVDEGWVDVDVSGEAVYFGFGIIGKILVGVLCMVTILVGRPLLGWLIPKFVSIPDAVRAHPRYRTAMAGGTWIIVGYEWISSIWDIWLYNNSDVSIFILTRAGVNFIVSFLFITAGLMYIDRTLDPVEEYPGLTKLLERSGRMRS